MRKLKFDNGERYVLSFEEKHGTHNFVILSQEELSKACLRVLKNRFDEGWYFKPDKKDYSLLLNEIPYNEEEIKTLKEPVQESAIAFLKAYKREQRAFEDDTFRFETIIKALETQDGKLAYQILELQSDHEYEKMDLILAEKI